MSTSLNAERFWKIELQDNFEIILLEREYLTYN